MPSLRSYEREGIGVGAADRVGSIFSGGKFLHTVISKPSGWSLVVVPSRPFSFFRCSWRAPRPRKSSPRALRGDASVSACLEAHGGQGEPSPCRKCVR